MADAPQDFAALLERFQKQYAKIARELGKVVIGQKDVIRQMLAALFCRSHCLLVGVPGLAKTLMVRAMADFKFLPGPIFAHIVLADEINRTPPKTQAALLEAMQERQVSVGKVTYGLPSPFFVIATQNPIEQEGTYPLPEAQLDRFMLNIHVDYPSETEEREIFRTTTSAPAQKLSPVLTADDIFQVQEVVDRIVVSDYVIQYVTDLVRATRPSNPKAPDYIREMVDWGAGPRAGQYLIRGAKALAALDGRFNASCADVREMAVPVLRHRIGTNFQAEAANYDSVKIIEMLLKGIPEPEMK